MSKDSSIKVFAENVGDTNPRPVNNIPVWIENVSAEFGGAGGSTVTSADVLPPAPTGTGNTYALYWNDANGLFWDIR